MAYMCKVPSLREVLKIDRRWHICARAATCLGKFQKLTPGGIYLLLVGLFWVLEVLKFDTRWLIHVLGLLCAWKVLKIDTRWHTCDRNVWELLKVLTIGTRWLSSLKVCNGIYALCCSCCMFVKF